MSRKLTDKYLSAVGTRCANGFREVIIGEFEAMVADGHNPHAARYGVLTALMLNMGDIIGASDDEADRAEMQRFIRTGGMDLMLKHSETVVERVAELVGAPRNNN